MGDSFDLNKTVSLFKVTPKTDEDERLIHVIF